MGFAPLSSPRTHLGFSHVLCHCSGHQLRDQISQERRLAVWLYWILESLVLENKLCVNDAPHTFVLTGLGLCLTGARETQII